MRRTTWMEGNRKHFSPLFDLVEKIIVKGEDILKSVPLSTEQSMLARTILSKRVLSHAEAIVVLVSYGFLTEARVLHRSAIEALLKFGALCEDKDAYKDFVAQQGISKRTQAQDLLQLRQEAKLGEHDEPTVAQITELLEKANAELRTYAGRKGVKTIRKIESFEWALRAKLTQFFWGYYARRSDSAHHAIMDLSRDLVRDQRSEVVGINLGPDREDPADMLTDAADLIRIAVEKLQMIAAIKLGDDFRESLQQLAKMRGEQAAAKRAAINQAKDIGV